jgi:hypothetical protein
VPRKGSQGHPAPPIERRNSHESDQHLLVLPALRRRVHLHPPEHGLCGQCISELETLTRLAPIANQPCPLCGGPVCADCGKALVTLIPIPPGLAKPAREVSGDDS